MDRRRALGFLAAGFSALAPPVGAEGAGIERAIRSSGERLAPLGLGTWLTFDVSDAGQRRARGEVLREAKTDGVQSTYRLTDRRAEPLFAVAADRGIAVIVNRRCDGGELFGAKTAKPLPGWGAELGCSTWAGGFLKFVLSQPAATCAIPATSKLAHLRENMRAMAGPLPHATRRPRLVADYLRAQALLLI